MLAYDAPAVDAHAALDDLSIFAASSAEKDICKQLHDVKINVPSLV